MVWENAPAVVVQMKAQLKLCTSLQTVPFNLSDSQYHYPTFTPAVTTPNAEQGIVPDQMPAILILNMDTDRDSYADGAQKLGSGTLVVVIYADTTSAPDVGTLETLADNIQLDLGLQYFGIYFRKMRKGLSSDLSPGQQAAVQDNPAAGFRTYVLQFDWGLARGRT